MRLTTDANDTVTLADIVREHGKTLMEKMQSAQQKPGSAGVLEADALLSKLQKLSRQAGACGYKLDGDKKPQTKLEELRETLRKAGREV